MLRYHFLASLKDLCISNPMVYLRPSCYFRKMQVMFLYLALYVLFVFSILFFADSLFSPIILGFLSLSTYSTNHAGVIMCCCHDSFVVPNLYCSYICDTNYYSDTFRSNADRKICKRQSAKRRDVKSSLWASSLRHNVIFLPPLSPKCLFRESRVATKA